MFGVADKKWGEAPIAALVLRREGAAAAEDLKAWINERVGAKFQRVLDVVLMQDFPRNVAGKPLKRIMRDEYRRR